MVPNVNKHVALAPTDVIYNAKTCPSELPEFCFAKDEVESVAKSLIVYGKRKKLVFALVSNWMFTWFKPNRLNHCLLLFPGAVCVTPA